MEQNLLELQLSKLVELHLDLLMGIDLELRSMALDPLQTAMEKRSAGSNASISPSGPSSASVPIFAQYSKGA